MEIDECTSECCLNATAPYQPDSPSTLKLMKQKDGSRFRSLNPSWYKEFSWLHVCTMRKKVFCYYCLKAYSSGLITVTDTKKMAFFSEGFGNWKKATERFRVHQESEIHKDSKLKLNSIALPSIKEKLSTAAAKAKADHTRMLLKVLSSVKYLLRQGLALRGHKETDGNLYQLLALQAADDPFLGIWLKKDEYLSPQIINELITLSGNAVLREILAKIHSSTWFAVLADEATDVSNQEQLSLSVRWVDRDYVINEDFIGLVHVPDITAATLTTAIKDVLIRCSLPLSQCRGQAYDGAANMMGHLRGVAKQIQSVEELAIPIHCLAHCLNLCLQDVAKKCVCIRDALDLVFEICQLIKYSPKRSLVFQQCKEDLSIGGTGLKPLCPTRWTVRSVALDAILRNYPALLEAFERISSSSYDDYGRRANGVLTQLGKFSVFFGLKLSHLVFGGTEQVSIALQAKDTSVQEALGAARLAKQFITRQREDRSFETFYSLCVNASGELTEEPSLPRYRRPPRRIDEGSNPHSFSSPKEYFRRQYFEVLDNVNGELERRFDQQSFKLPKAIEELLLKACSSNSSNTIPEIITKSYSRDINISKLECQLNMLPDLVKAYKSYKQLNILCVTSLRTISSMLLEVPLSREIYSEIDIILRIYFTIPITTATAERSFSVLRRVKNYLRSTMTESRLNNVMLLHTHKDITDDLDIIKIAKEFISANSRRLNYFALP